MRYFYLHNFIKLYIRLGRTDWASGQPRNKICVMAPNIFSIIIAVFLSNTKCMSACIEHKSIGWTENPRSHQNLGPSVW